MQCEDDFESGLITWWSVELLQEDAWQDVINPVHCPETHFHGLQNQMLFCKFEITIWIIHIWNSGGNNGRNEITLGYNNPKIFIGFKGAPWPFVIKPFDKCWLTELRIEINVCQLWKCFHSKILHFNNINSLSVSVYDFWFLVQQEIGGEVPRNSTTHDRDSARWDGLSFPTDFSNTSKEVHENAIFPGLETQRSLWSLNSSFNSFNNKTAIWSDIFYKGYESSGLGKINKQTIASHTASDNVEDRKSTNEFFRYNGLAYEFGRSSQTLFLTTGWLDDQTDIWLFQIWKFNQLSSPRNIWNPFFISKIYIFHRAVDTVGGCNITWFTWGRETCSVSYEFLHTKIKLRCVNGIISAKCIWQYHSRTHEDRHATSTKLIWVCTIDGHLPLPCIQRMGYNQHD